MGIGVYGIRSALRHLQQQVKSNPRQPSLGRRWVGHVGTLWLHHEPALFWSQPNQHLLFCLFFCGFPWFTSYRSGCVCHALQKSCSSLALGTNSLETILLLTLLQSEGFTVQVRWGYLWESSGKSYRRKCNYCFVEWSRWEPCWNPQPIISGNCLL